VESEACEQLSIEQFSIVLLSTVQLSTALDRAALGRHPRARGDPGLCCGPGFLPSPSQGQTLRGSDNWCGGSQLVIRFMTGHLPVMLALTPVMLALTPVMVALVATTHDFSAARQDIGVREGAGLTTL
jgi:hypothetical protein